MGLRGASKSSVKQLVRQDSHDQLSGQEVHKVAAPKPPRPDVIGPWAGPARPGEYKQVPVLTDKTQGFRQEVIR